MFVCQNRRPAGTPKGSCATRGAEAIHKALKAEIASRGLALTEVRACTSSCLDVCWAGPVLMLSDGRFYGRVTLADVGEIVDALQNHATVERLLLSTSEFDAATAGAQLAELPDVEKKESG
jgi:(2Fe-2S) ferredoxin